MIESALVLAFLAGIVAAILVHREAMPFVRKGVVPLGGKPCLHDGAPLDCGRCGKRLLPGGTGMVVSHLHVLPSPAEPTMVRVAIRLSDEFVPFVDMAPEQAGAFLRTYAAVMNATPYESDDRTYRLDAPGGPRCWCGAPSALESGACSVEH